MKRLAVIGASGHGKVVADAALLSGWDDVVFFDDRWPTIASIGPWRVAGATERAFDSSRDAHGIVVAIGDNRARISFHRRLAEAGLHSPIVRHPSAVVSPFARLGDGSVVLANATVNPFAVLGDAAIINTAASVDHDCVLGEAVHLSPGARLNGNVSVGDRSWIGAGAVVKHGVAVGRDAIVGAGAVVIHDVSDNDTVAGVPARSLAKRISTPADD